MEKESVGVALARVGEARKDLDTLGEGVPEEDLEVLGVVEAHFEDTGETGGVRELGELKLILGEREFV